MAYKIIFGIIIALFIIILIVIVRTLRFKAADEIKIFKESVDYDKLKAVTSLQEMIKCKTVSNIDESLEDYNEFIKFENLLEKLFPNVYKICELKKLGNHSLLFKWKGLNDNKNVVLMAHYDVVPADSESWSKDPFAAIIENDILWGRGTLDTKITVNGILNAVETLIGNGFTPKSNIYIAFGGNEEVSGDGASVIVNYFKENSIDIDLVLDEGGAVVEGVFPGVNEKIAVVGIAEKGFASLKLEVKENGGHASTPEPNGAIIQLSKACINIEKKPFKQNLTLPTLKLFDTLGRRSTFLYRMIFANLWLFKGVLNKICVKSGGELNALTRTTCAFTQMKGSKAVNVLPVKASVCLNLRIISGETIESTTEYIKKIINNDNISTSIIQGCNPSTISETNCNQWNIIEKAIHTTWDKTIVTPYLMIACSDSRHYSDISNHVYRFSAMHLSKEERKLIHGNDERVPVGMINKTVEFYIRLIKEC